MHLTMDLKCKEIWILEARKKCPTPVVLLRNNCYVDDLASPGTSFQASLHVVFGITDGEWFGNDKDVLLPGTITVFQYCKSECHGQTALTVAHAFVMFCHAFTRVWFSNPFETARQVMGKGLCFKCGKPGCTAFKQTKLRQGKREKIDQAHAHIPDCSLFQELSMNCLVALLCFQQRYRGVAVAQKFAENRFGDAEVTRTSVSGLGTTRIRITCVGVNHYESHSKTASVL